MSHISAAGVLPKGFYNGAEYCYFGEEKKKSEITVFLGKKDKPTEKNRKCAIREFMEESLGAIASKKQITSILKKFKNVARIENPKAKQVTFIARVAIKGNPMTKFQEKLKKQKSHHKKEIRRIIAIKTSHLRNMVANNQSQYQGLKFRGDTWGTLKLALQKGQL